jgi:hypothetical protein
LTSAEKVENKTESNFAIPLLARTHLATIGETTSNPESSAILEDEVCFYVRSPVSVSQSSLIY